MPEQDSTSAPVHYWRKGGVRSLISRLALRPLQFVFAMVVAALYGIDLAHATKTNNTAPAEWVYAEFIVTLSAITCIVHFFVPVIHAAWSTWDGILFVLWLAQTGVFGNIYISGPIDDDHRKATLSIPRMCAAVWLDLISMLLWLTTFILGITCCCRARKSTCQGDEPGDTKSHLMNNHDEECPPPEYTENPKEDLTANPAGVERTPDVSKEVLQGEMESQDAKVVAKGV